MNVIQVNAVVVKRFRRLMSSDRLAHAYLFVGPYDAGKTQTALAVAQLVNCAEVNNEGACGICPSCKKIASGNHPDVCVIGNDEEDSIKIEEIRFLLGREQLRPYEALKKVFIVRNVEKMTTQAANALLKTLEEPSASTLIILTTTAIEANLDTIRSRCHTVQFFPASVNRIAQVLKEEGVHHQTASFLSVYADGCLGKARKLAAGGIAERKNRIVDQMLFSARVDDYLKGLASDKEVAVEALNVLLSFFRDALLLKAGVGVEALIHQDRIKDLETQGNRPIADLTGIISQIIQTKKLIDDNLNMKMSLALLKERIGS